MDKAIMIYNDDRSPLLWCLFVNQDQIEKKGNARGMGT